MEREWRLGVLLLLKLGSREEGVDELMSEEEENPTVAEKVAQPSQASTSRGSVLTLWE